MEQQNIFTVIGVTMYRPASGDMGRAIVIGVVMTPVMMGALAAPGVSYANASVIFAFGRRGIGLLRRQHLEARVQSDAAADNCIGSRVGGA